MDKKQELIKNLKCDTEQASAIMGELSKMAHDHGIVTPEISQRVANIAAGRRWEGKPECAMAGRMHK